MYRTATRIVSLIAVMAGGILLPPAACAADYYLFVSYTSSRTCDLFQMDGQGNLQYRQQLQTGWESSNFETSPDGRMVVIGANYPPLMTIYFIGENGLISDPLYMNNPGMPGAYYNPIAFHRTLPLFYAGWNPVSKYKYCLSKHSVEFTSQTIEISGAIGSPYKIGYSQWSNSLVYSKDLSPMFESDIYMIGLDENGSFNSIKAPLKSTNRIGDIVTSPDGRWVAGVSMEIPKLQFFRIAEEGTISVSQAIDYSGYDVANWPYLAFLPDNRRLLMLAQGNHMLTLFEIDEAEGKLVSRAVLSNTTPGWHVGGPLALAVTPDGRYAAFRSINEQAFGHNYIHVVRINDDDTLEYLYGKEVDVDGYVSNLGFAIMPRLAAKDWELYE